MGNSARCCLTPALLAESRAMETGGLLALILHMGVFISVWALCCLHMSFNEKPEEEAVAAVTDYLSFFSDLYFITFSCEVGH